MNNTFTGHNTFIFLFPTRPRAFFFALICSEGHHVPRGVGRDGELLPWCVNPSVRAIRTTDVSLSGVTPKVRSSVMLGHGFPVGDWNAARAAYRPSPRKCGDNLRQYMYINRSRAKECLRGHYLAPCVLKYHFGAVQVGAGGVQERVPPRDHDKTV